MKMSMYDTIQYGIMEFRIEFGQNPDSIVIGGKFLKMLREFEDKNALRYTRSYNGITIVEESKNVFEIRRGDTKAKYRKYGIDEKKVKVFVEAPQSLDPPFAGSTPSDSIPVHQWGSAWGGDPNTYVVHTEGQTADSNS
jgi:hypothetical protein